MQRNVDNGSNYYSKWSDNPKSRQQQRPNETRDRFGKVAADNSNLANPTSYTTAYLKYFNVVQPVEVSMFSDQNLYDESETPLFLNTPLTSNSGSGIVNDKNAFASRGYWKKSVQHHGNRQPQFNDKKYPNKYRKNRNYDMSKFNEFISQNNVHNTPSGNDQSGSTNDSACPALLKPLTLTKNTLTIKKCMEKYRNYDYDSECDSDPGDIEKMNSMTAADFNNDRYARYGIHESEIKDYVRTITYINCIEYCAKEYIKDKVVLVVRCGIGLLPLLCARDGQAKKVIALEQSACIEYARRIITDNRYSTVITLIQSNVHDLKQLPHKLKKVDVIIADFLGDCVLSQGDQMEQVIEARDRFLVSEGLMIPMCVTLYGQLLEQRRVFGNCRLRKSTKKKTYKKYVNKYGKSEAQSSDTDSSTDSTLCSWWKNVYGFDMRSNTEIVVDSNSESVDCPDSAKDEWHIMDEPLVTFFDPCKVVSNACLIKKFDMYKCTIKEVRHVHCKNLMLECTTPYSSANGGDYAHMLELFMVVDFPNGQKIVDDKDDLQIGFSTSSFSPYTRFRQTGLMLRDQLLVEQGDKFRINEFRMWRGPQQSEANMLIGEITKSTRNRFGPEENLKLRLRYTFVNKYTKAINRRCAYTLVKQLF